MTVREQVVTYLQSIYPITTTNARLAYHLNLPEASVRRATLHAFNNFEIADRGLTPSAPYAVLWGAPTPVPTIVEFDTAHGLSSN